MDIKTYLDDYRRQAIRFLDTFFAAEEKRAVKISPLCAQMIRIYRDYMRGGKMARGALVCLGYELAGKKRSKKIVQASAAMEIIHSAILIWDDIMDRDSLRRGRSTVHKQFEKIHQQKYRFGESTHYGTSMGVNLGGTGFFLGNLCFSSSSFSDQVKNRGFEVMSRGLLHVGYGQALDVTYECLEKLGEADVLRVHENKTAGYTIVLPLQIGVILGGKEELLKPIEKYGYSLGVAFQLKDDILGMFGAQEKIGKAVDSDLRERKNTLLVIKALELAKPEEKDFLLSVWGSNKISSIQLKKAREIVKNSGSLAYSQKLMEKLISESKRSIPKVTTCARHQAVLTSLADYLIKREK